MARRKKHQRSRKTGLPPGTVIYVGNQPEREARLELFCFDKDGVTCPAILQPAEVARHRQPGQVIWLNLDSLHDLKMIQQVGEHFGIHKLVLEDIVNTEQRPKMETADHHLFMTLKMIIQCPDDVSEPEMEQVSFILGKDYLITFQEQEGDVFDPARERLKNPDSILRQQGPDFLMYRLIDLVVDRYLVILEEMSHKLDEIEDEVTDSHIQSGMARLQHLKRQLIHMRRAIIPLREAVSALLREESGLITTYTRRYLSDVSDHLVQVLELLESHREICIELREMHLTLLSNRTNEVMKFLTIIATIFIPLTFIVGVYGMNFRFMPELEWRYGYALVWLIMVIVGVVMLGYFRRKRML